MKSKGKVIIRPKTSILSVLKYLEYETWYALAEFVDNAVDSYQKYEKKLKRIEGEDFTLKVEIEINDQEHKITIRDNAAGISERDFPRAFRAAEVPPDKDGLSEFGMGMKSAACWFSDSWSVTTKALGELEERKVYFDINEIKRDDIEELDIYVEPAEKNEHYTKIELLQVKKKLPRKRTLGKVKDHLTGIYRDFIRKGVLVLKLDGEELEFEEPKILVVPRFDDLKGKAITWKRDIHLNLGNGQSVHGFVAIRERASTSEAGFALFRRGRIIEGSFDNTFRPEYIFGAPNTFRYQRVFGELHLEGFDAIFTKKGILWDDTLEPFLELLREELSRKSFPLLQQAERYRVRASEKDYEQGAKKALDETMNDLEKRGEMAIADVRDSPRVKRQETQQLSKTNKSVNRELELRFGRTTWRVYIELSYDPSIRDLIEVGDHLISGKLIKGSVRQIGIRLSLVHPFMTAYVGADSAKIEPILRIAAALGLAEVIATESGSKSKSEVRKNLNELITILSSPED